MRPYGSALLLPGVAAGVLMLVGLAAGAQAPQPAPGGSGGAFTALALNEGQNHAEEPSLPPDASFLKPFGEAASPSSRMDNPQLRHHIADTDQERPNGFRIYRLKMKSKEKIIFKLKAESAADMSMRFIRTTTMDPLAYQVRAANLAPMPVRHSVIKIENPTAEAHDILLYLSGKTGYAYALDLSRTGGN